MDVAEVYSPPRVKLGLSTGVSVDKITGYDLGCEEDRKKMWGKLKEDDPLLIVLSPPCTAFCKLQNLNYGKMNWEQAVTMICTGIEHLEVAAAVAKWQMRRRRLFALENPVGSLAWDEKCILELMGIRRKEGS